MEKNKSIHPRLRDMDSENELHPTKVKQWIKHQKTLLSSARARARAAGKNAGWGEVETIRGYIRYLENYLRTGLYHASYWGKDMENRMEYVSIALAYDKNGNVKRQVGVFYPDLGAKWTQEMDVTARAN